MKTCKNCGALTSGLYCSNCGQRPVPERITFHYIWHEIVHFFTHAEKGFFFTSLQLVKAPGLVIKNFIEGKRKNYQKPVSYYLIWIGLYSLILYLLEKTFGENKVVSFADYFGPGETTKFAISHLNIVLTLLLPVQAVYVYFLLMQNQYNYVEALVVMLYAIGTVILLQTVFVMICLIWYLITGNSISVRWSDLLKILYIGWMLIDVANVLGGRGKYLRAVIAMVLLMGTFTLWRLYVSPGFANLFF
jgi:hypothetical protein